MAEEEELLAIIPRYHTLKLIYLGMKKLFHIWCGRKLDELVAGGWGCFVPLFAVLLARCPPVVVTRDGSLREKGGHIKMILLARWPPVVVTQDIPSTGR